MGMRRWALVVAVAIWLGATPATQAASPTLDAGIGLSPSVFGGIVFGQARDILTERPVAGAFVYLEGGRGGVFTDASGYYSLSAAPGQHTVSLRAPGYLAMSQTYVQVLVGRAVRVDFGLVVDSPTPAQEQELFHRMVTPPEQAWSPGFDVGVAAVPSTIRVLMPNGQVVEMDLEKYVKGVVPQEMPPSAPMEALKAQAVAARSYAVTSWNHAAQGANVCTTTHCQVWKGIHFSRTDQAVEETRGVFATYRGSIIRAFYFGHCDGHTRNSEDVWVQALPYCRSVACECGYTWIWGHGVGMCQEGAIAMAKRGATFDKILRHYYTGISLLGVQPTPTPQPTLTPTPTPTPVATFTWPLQAGWNLLSIPVAITDTTPSNVFASIAGRYDMAMQYDAFASYARWRVYQPALGTQTGGLDALDLRYGIWLRATEPCTLTLSGQRILTATEVPLINGLNLVAYPSLQTRSVEEALAPIAGKYVRVYTYRADQPESPWLVYDFTIPAELNALKEFTPGMGYWIEMVQPANWRVDP